MNARMRRPRKAALAASGLSLLLAAAAAAPASAAAESKDGGARSFTIRDKRITESSGLAASRRHRGVYWTHNDSDDGPYVYAVDSATGKTVATVTLRGIHPRDVEAISLGPDGDIYVGDIGDNLGGTWSEVWIYRFHEPERLHDETVTPTRYTVRYADGPRDAESLMVHPKTGRVYIASKNQDDKGGVYAGPERLSPSGVNTFHRIARTHVWATDGAFSPDGTRLVLRGYLGGEMYRWSDGRPRPLGGVSVPLQGQGESVTFTPDGRTLMFGSEGADSTVDPVGLDGRLLPEDAAAADAKGEAAAGSRGAAHDADGRGGRDGHGGGSGDDGIGLGGAALVAAAVVGGLWAAGRRLFGRRE